MEFLTVLNSSSRKETNCKVQQKGVLTPNEENDAIFSVGGEIEEDEILNLQSLILELTSSENLERHMISYTASVLQNDIIQGKWYWQMKCEECLRVFTEDDLIDDDLVNMKMYTTRLRPAAKSTFEICVATEKLMEKFNYEPRYYETIPIEVLRIIHIDDLFSYSSFDNHCETNHKERLIGLIIKMYVNKRQLYISRCNTLALHGDLLRRKLKKVVHFKGQ